MTKPSGEVYLSPIDEERFGIRTARAPGVTLDNLPHVIDFCHIHKVVLLIARCLCSELRATQAMEREGFLLMDTLVYWVRNLKSEPLPFDQGEGVATIRTFGTGEEETIKLIAAESFRRYYGHYHADERLDRAKCDEAYVSWAFRSCVSRDAADEVLVAELEGSLVGLATLRLNTEEEGEGILFGVAPLAQKYGIYRSFMIHGMNWCVSKGASRMVVSTQITNVAVQGVWSRLGFVPTHAYYTFHKWFD